MIKTIEIWNDNLWKNTMKIQKKMTTRKVKNYFRNIFYITINTTKNTTLHIKYSKHNNHLGIVYWRISRYKIYYQY